MPVTMNPSYPTLGPAPAACDPCARYCLTGPRRVLALSTRWQAAQARQLPQPGTQVATPLYQLRHEGAKSFPSPACPSTPRRDLRASNQADGHCKRHQLLRALLKEDVASGRSNLRALQTDRQTNKQKQTLGLGQGNEKAQGRKKLPGRTLLAARRRRAQTCTNNQKQNNQRAIQGAGGGTRTQQQASQARNTLADHDAPPRRGVAQ